MKNIRNIFFKLFILVALVITAFQPYSAAAQDMRSLSISTIGNGEIILAPPGGLYESGTSVNMTAQAGDGWEFTGWGGAASGTGNPYSLTITDNITVTATFTEIPVTYTLAVNVVGSGSVTRNPDKTTYNSGEQVQMTANPMAGWAFAGWSGGLSGTTNPQTITMSDNKTVTATFTEIPATYTLAVNIVGSGSVARNPDKTAYNSGESVQLTANPVAGWVFAGWSGGLSGTTNPQTITMSDNKTVTATFTEIPVTYTLAINVVGSGSVTRNPDKTTYYSGEQVQMTANPAAGWAFAGWSGGLSGTTNPQTITMDGNKSVIATFTQNTYTVTTDNMGSGAITSSPDQASFHYGDIVQLTAAPGSGWSFTGWSGNVTGSQNPLSVTVYGEISITATFSQDTYPFTINTVGNGIVIRNPDQASYNYGTLVQITADPDDGWSFAGWSGNITGNTNPLTLTIHGLIDLTATFTQNQYILTINTVGNGSVSRAPNQAAYTYGTTVQLSAIPTNDWVFEGWGGDISGQDNPKPLTIYQDTVVQASFRISGNNSWSRIGGNPSGDGGNNSGTTYYSPGTTQISPFINNSGMFMLDAAVKSDDGLVLLNIYEGVLAQTKEKTVLKAISIVPVDSPATAFAGSRLIGRTYEVSPDGATFSPTITLAIFYDPAALPGDIDLDSMSIILFNPVTAVWEAVPSIHNKAESYVTASIDHFSIYTILAKKLASPVTTLPPAVAPQDQFSITDLSVSPGSASPGQKITISAHVNNLGNITRTYQVTLKINDTVEMIRATEIPAGNSVAVTFNITRKDPGNYQVEVNGSTTSFTIMETPPNSRITPTPLAPNTTTTRLSTQGKYINWMIIAIFGLAFCFIIILFIVMNQRKK